MSEKIKQQAEKKHGVHIMVKPVGAFCNLKCTYCFYLEKQAFYETNKLNIMSLDTLEHFIKLYIETNDFPEVHFVWQGGEPMLAGLDFYKSVVEIQNKYSKGKIIHNSLQSNGVLLDDEWCKFLKENNFLVGISLDGPEEVTNLHRKFANNENAFNSIIKGVKLLQKYKIEYSVLACVTSSSADKPLEVYNFFKDNNIKRFQFTPVVERIANDSETSIGLNHASPDGIGKENVNYGVTEWSVKKGQYSKFLKTIFDEWSENDVGEIFVQNFDWALASWLGLRSNVCIFSENCGNSLIIEYNGDIYSCDHYMYPKHKLGNINSVDLDTMINSKKQLDFGCKKSEVPTKCLTCNAYFACKGECPRHRFDFNVESGEFESYLCSDYYSFFYHIHPKTKAMAQLVSNGLPAKEVMTLKNKPVVIYKK